MYTKDTLMLVNFLGLCKDEKVSNVDLHKSNSNRSLIETFMILNGVHII